MDLVDRLLPRRGEVWLARLDPTVGNEIQKTRPCLIVSPDSLNRFLGTVILMPMTSCSHQTRFRLRSAFGGVEGLLLGDQIRSAAREQLLKNLGRADDAVLSAALAILREMFAD